MPAFPDYLQYSVEDFAQDEWFVRWVLTPDADTEAFWQDWLATYPFRREEVEAARQLLLALHQLPQPRLAADEKIALKQRIFAQLAPPPAPEERPTQMTRRPVWYWAAAAALLVALLGGWQLWQALRPAGPGATYEEMLAHARRSGPWREIRNDKASGQLVRLPDGSSVLLRPQSRLAFPAGLAGSTRPVYLQGAAFFEVAKNPGRPFFVHTAHLVTKVLGTSFEVQAQPEAPRVTVTVTTGRVSVYPRASRAASLHARTRKLEGFVLVPNQQATFRLADRKLLRTLVPQPALQPGARHMPAFEYAETPIRQVFSQLEQAYGVDIVYDEAALGNCPLTASLRDEPLFEKLNLICKAVQANYEVLDAQIVVTGHGCQ
ncbi:FecR family protein [Hymenobacter weizhouensis]|uniref:FecR family protein n=1 Tax=Hymenobacter sp. YIM 151500-1 TaxID=2987689 RepID=UPI0022271390|nr:FecR family protein [Hymenobacter sp. YIM 151500-1]UYZ64008.1 FecR family protein [Hymenobacter sp. YIM 151500-1]